MTNGIRIFAFMEIMTDASRNSRRLRDCYHYANNAAAPPQGVWQYAPTLGPILGFILRPLRFLRLIIRVRIGSLNAALPR